MGDKLKCLQFVQCRSFASVVQSYNDNFELIVAEEALPDLSKYHAHFVCVVVGVNPRLQGTKLCTQHLTAPQVR